MGAEAAIGVTLYLHRPDAHVLRVVCMFCHNLIAEHPTPTPPQGDSHGICEPCFEHHYPDEYRAVQLEAARERLQLAALAL